MRESRGVPEIVDSHSCILGEGVFWHPLRGQLFWFDVLTQQMFSIAEGCRQAWQFGEAVSAAGWIDRDHLLVAGASGLFQLNLATGATELVIGLEADRADTRSNDGRADPFGGFWIGTMGWQGETGKGSIYRYYQGQVALLFAGIDIPNAISFSPDGKNAYFADTSKNTIYRVGLDSEGLPVGEKITHIVVPANHGHPDGAVVDLQGRIWVAMWGTSRVNCYSPDGQLLDHVALAARHTSCPAFGGEGLSDLYVTSASIDVTSPGPHEGATFRICGAGRGQAEHRVLLSRST